MTTNYLGAAVPPDPQPDPSARFDLGAFGIDPLPPAPFFLRLHIGEAHIGQVIRHVPNTEYVRWLEAMAVAHSASLGYTAKWHHQRGILWFVRRHEIDYLAEVFEGDVLSMATWVAGMEKARSHRRYLIVRPGDGTVICRGETVWVLMDLKARRPMRVPGSMVERYVSVEPGAEVPELG